jgi:hypothetical protein
MGLVHDEKSDTASAKGLQMQRIPKALSSQQYDFKLALADPTLSLPLLLRRHRRVEARCRNARPLQVLDLIFHQRYQRRNNHHGALQK